jgi:hypothetical protein
MSGSGVPIGDLARLKASTPRAEVKKRPIFNKQKEKVGELDYVDARFVMDRLDDVVGPGRWQDEYVVLDDGVKGRIGILIEGIGWVWKEDVGTESTIEETKGSFSDAFKRAAVKWGIARDLYENREGQSGKPVQAPAGHSTTQTRARTGRATSYPVDNATAPWVCPVHEAVVAFPAGTSAQGRAYPAFYACPKGRDCDQRAPRDLAVLPEHLGGANDPGVQE